MNLRGAGFSLVHLNPLGQIFPSYHGIQVTGSNSPTREEAYFLFPKSAGNSSAVSVNQPHTYVSLIPQTALLQLYLFP